MNAFEFQTYIRRSTRWERGYYFILLIVLLLLGVGAGIMGAGKSEPLLYAACSILIGFAVLGFYKLPNRYKVRTITSNQPPEKIRKAVYEALEELDAPVRLLTEQPLSFTYSKGFWASSYRIHLCYDAYGVYFSVQGHGSSDGGFIDFGGTQRIRSRVADAIEQRLLYAS